MYRQVLPVILGIHGICALIYSFFILNKKSHIRKEFIIPLFLVPVFGVAAAIIIELINSKKKQGKQTLDLHKFFLDDDAYWKAINNRQEDENIVPLEEAMTINDEKVRRKLMLETLFDDPLKYLDVLMIARKNEDIETAHYASATISKIQSGFQREIQRSAFAVENNPDDIILLDHYIDALEKHIESGVLEDYLLRRQRIIFARALDLKLDQNKKDQETIIKKIHNSLQLGDFSTAYEASNLLKINWPQEEETWVEAVRVCVESKDKARLKETIDEVRQTKIGWTKHGKEQVAPWLSGV